MGLLHAVIWVTVGAGGLSFDPMFAWYAHHYGRGAAQAQAQATAQAQAQAQQAAEDVQASAQAAVVRTNFSSSMACVCAFLQLHASSFRLVLALHPGCCEQFQLASQLMWKLRASRRPSAVGDAPRQILRQ